MLRTKKNLALYSGFLFRGIYLARRSAWFAPRLHAYMVPEHPGEILDSMHYGFYNGNRIPTHWGDVSAELVAENEWCVLEGGDT